MLGGLSGSERRPGLKFIAKLSDYLHFQSKANKELLKKSFLFSINLMVSTKFFLPIELPEWGNPYFSETLYRILNFPSGDVAQHPLNEPPPPSQGPGYAPVNTL